jgi:Inositol-pentakisphosphate 2-kinase
MSPENWVYRVEGAMHLLFEHKKSPFVLRLANSKRRDADISKALKAEHCFVRAVFGQGPLGPYILCGNLVRVTEQFINDLNAQSEASRPRFRSSQARILCPQPIAVLQNDLGKRFSSGNLSERYKTVCVEVKPKGGLTSVSRLNPKTLCDNLGKFEKLYYAIKNFDMVSSDNAPHIPRYSPSDLLSGEYEKIVYAMKAMVLRKSGGLRIFCDGDIALAHNLDINVDSTVFDQGLRGTTDFQFNSKSDITASQPLNARDIKEYAYNSIFCQESIAVASEILAKEKKLLNAILFEQGRDFIDSSGGEFLWQQLVDNMDGDLESAKKMVVDAYMLHLHQPQQLEEVSRARQNLSYKDSQEALALHSDNLMQDARNYVKNMSSVAISRVLADYLTAGVAKDCSIMISMSCRPLDHIHGSNESFIELEGGYVCLYSVHVVDIGPKPCSKIQEWVNRDQVAEKFILANTARIGSSTTEIHPPEAGLLQTFKTFTCSRKVLFLLGLLVLVLVAIAAFLFAFIKK